MAKCPYCLTTIELRGVVPVITCSSCNTTHHSQCWNEYGGCSILGCIHNPSNQGRRYGGNQNQPTVRVNVKGANGEYQPRGRIRTLMLRCCIIVAIIFGVCMLLAFFFWGSFENSVTNILPYDEDNSRGLYTPESYTSNTPKPTRKPTNTPKPASTLSSANTSTSYSCPDKARIQIHLGDRATISWVKVNLRSSPKVPLDYYENIVTELNEGDRMTVVGGPKCAHDGTWWEIKTDSGYSGWIREYSKGNYLIRPIP